MITSRFRILFVAFVFVFGGIRSQTFNKDSFIKSFNSADLKNKVKMTAELSAENLGEAYPLIKDSLELIKEKVRYRTTSTEAKFLFDLIDARLELNARQTQKAIFTLEKSLRFNTQNLSDSLKLLPLLLDSYMKLRNYNKAFEVEETMQLRKNRWPKDFADHYSPRKSYIFLQLGLYKKSVVELRKEFTETSLRNKPDTAALTNFYNNIGVHFNRANILDSATIYFNRAQQLASVKAKTETKGLYYAFLSALIDGNLASVMAKRKMYKEAIPALKKDIYYSLKVNNYESAVNSYNLITECYLETGQNAIAAKYLDTSKIILAKVENVNPVLKNILVQAKFYRFTGDLKRSIDLYEKYIQFKDSLNSVDKEMQLNNQQIIFDLYQKENLLVEKEKVIQEAKLDYEREKTHRANLTLGIFVLLGVVILLGIRMKRRRGNY